MSGVAKRLFYMNSPRKAFTLVELLVVISIIGLVAGLGIPAVNAGLGKARDGACLANLRQLGTAFLSYSADNGGYLPRANNNAVEGNPNGVEWPKAIYEYIPTKSGSITGKQVNKVFLCPAEKQPPDSDNSCWQYTASFALEAGNSSTKPTGDSGNGPRTLASIEQPTKTILLVDGKIGISSYPYQTESATTWNAVRADLAKAQTGLTDKVRFRHAGKEAINALYGDGHVGSIKWADRNDTTKFSEPVWRGRGF